MIAILDSLRPKQWLKNLILFAGLIFSKNFFHLPSLMKVVMAFIIFCGLSGAVYLINDLRDLAQDKAHPIKSKRPLPSGRLKISTAWITICCLIFFGLSSAFILDGLFGWMGLGYVVLMISYTLFIKHVVILDVLVIAFGFIIRAVAGALVIGVIISSWLLVCTVFLSLFLGLSKRRHELVLLGNEAENHRRILEEYSPYLLDQMVSITTASTVIAYTLYTTAPETVEKFGTRNLILTLPFVLYGIFRYLYLVHQKKLGGSPEMILFKDKPMIINIFLYILTIGLIIYLK